MKMPFVISINLSTMTSQWRPCFWLVIGLPIVVGAVLLLHLRRPATTAPSPSVVLTMTSRPPGATIRIDGQEYRHTPATLALPPGEHRVTLRHAATYNVRLPTEEVTSHTGTLWLRIPAVRPVRSPLPGATSAGTTFLADGRLALTIALPAGDERQVWVVDQDGATQRVGPPVARGAVALAPAGTRVTYLAQLSASAVPGAGWRWHRRTADRGLGH